MMAWRGKDAFISASFSCAVAASPPFPDATASPPRYCCILSFLPSQCLLPSPTPPYHAAPLLPLVVSAASPDPPADFHDDNGRHRGEDGRVVRRGSGKRGGGDAYLASAKQEVTAAQRRIRMKRTRYGEFETVARRGKDAFVSASPSCVFVASSPFPSTIASPSRYRRFLSSLPSRCLLLFPMPPYRTTAYKDCQEYCIYQLLTSQLLHQHEDVTLHYHRSTTLPTAPLPQPRHAAYASPPPTA